MAPVLLDGDALAARLRRDMTEAARRLRPRMVTVLVGDDPVSRAYISRKHQDCVELGIAAEILELPATISEADLLFEIRRLNADDVVDGFFVQFPLPPPLSEARVAAAISPAKDIDGLHPENLGRMLTGQAGLRPCTPTAVLELLSAHNVAIAGRVVALIGRGPLVGAPLAVLLAARGATLLHLNRATPDLAAFTAQADVVISAAGEPGLVTGAMIKPAAAVVGVGISYDAQGNMISDIAADVAEVAGFVTPPHGSVGPLTRAMLLRNLLCAAERARLGG